MTGSEAAAWIAAMAGAVALFSQGFTVLRNRKREQDQIETALSQQPAIRQQLELGNVGEAVKHLNVIIQSQADHIQMQDREMDELRTENAELRQKYFQLLSEVEEMRIQMARQGRKDHG